MMCVDGVYDSLDSSSNASFHSNTSCSDSSSGEEELYPNEGDLLVVRRLLGSRPKLKMMMFHKEKTFFLLDVL